MQEHTNFWDAVEVNIDLLRQQSSQIERLIAHFHKEKLRQNFLQRLNELEWDESVAYLAFYISPFTRFESNPQLKNIYYHAYRNEFFIF